MKTATLRLRLEDERVLALLAEVKSLVAAIGPVELLPDIAARFVDAPERINDLARLEKRPAPAGARETVLALEPTELLLELVAALRATQGESLVVGNQIGHTPPPANHNSLDA